MIYLYTGGYVLSNGTGGWGFLIRGCGENDYQYWGGVVGKHTQTSMELQSVIEALLDIERLGLESAVCICTANDNLILGLTKLIKDRSSKFPQHTEQWSTIAQLMKKHFILTARLTKGDRRVRMCTDLAKDSACDVRHSKVLISKRKVTSHAAV